MVFNCHIVPRNLLKIKPNIRYNSRLCSYDIKHIIFGNFTHLDLCKFLFTPSSRSILRPNKFPQKKQKKMCCTDLGFCLRVILAEKMWKSESVTRWPSDRATFLTLSSSLNDYLSHYLPSYL